MNSTRNTLLIFAVILLGFTGATAQETCRRHVEAQGGFSICMPDGWNPEPRPNEPYKMVFAPAAETFTPNLNFKTDTSASTLTNYVAMGIKNILASAAKINANNVRLVSWVDVKTNSGLAGQKTVYESEYKGLMIRSIQYYFDDGSNRKFIVTGTSLLRDKDTLDPVFERAAKSFQIEK